MTTSTTEKPKLLITGATGFLGTEIARLAIERNYEVYALYRNPNKKGRLKDLNVKFVKGDVTDIKSLEKALTGMDFAIHTAGDTSYDVRDLKRLEKINVEGVENFFKAAVKKGIKRVVHTSSVAALGFDPQGKVVDESVAYNWPADLPYMQTKRQGEDIALRYAANGLDVVIVNPATVLGPGPLNVSEEQMVRELEEGKALGIPKGGMTVCYLEDVALGHLLALEKGKKGERYILGGPHITHKEFYETFAKYLEVKAPKLILPNLALKALGEVARGVEKMGLTLGIPSAVLRLSPYGVYHACDKAKRELGYQDRNFVEIVQSVVKYRKALALQCRPS